ncbi:MAG: sulfate transporter CysZ [Chromatiales bacterium]
MRRLSQAVSSPVMLRDLKVGAGYVLIGFKLIVAPRLRRYVLVPLSINGLLFAAGIAYGAHLLDTLIDAWLPDWLRWLDWLLWPLFGLLVLGAVFFGFSLVANLIAAPFNGRLAEAVETHLRGEPMTATAGWSTALRDLVAGVGAQLRRLVYFGFWSLPFLVLSWIPGLGLPAALGWFFLGAWFMALQYTDYPMANHGLDFPAQRRLLGHRRWLALGFGIVVMVLTLIPVVNFLAMPIAVAGATAMWAGAIIVKPRGNASALPGGDNP